MVGDAVTSGEMDRVRGEADPLAQARLATELLHEYELRCRELSQLRAEAIRRTARETGMTFAAVARSVGLSKGRLSQIRHQRAGTPGGGEVAASG